MYKLLKLDQITHLEIYCVVWSAIFISLHYLVPKLLHYQWPLWWENLNPKKKTEMTPQVVALFHQVVVVSFAINMIYYELTEGYVVTAEVVKKLGPFVYGYFIGDTLYYAIPEATGGKFDFLIHHLVSIWVGTNLMNCTSMEMRRFCPHFLIMEISAVFFGFGWIMRITSYNNSIFITIFELLFAISFFIGRIVNFPYQVYVAWDASAEMGLSRYMFPLLLVLQFFWFYKILLQIAKLISGKKSKESVE